MKKRFLAALATGLLVVGIGGVAQADEIDWTQDPYNDYTSDNGTYLFKIVGVNDPSDSPSDQNVELLETLEDQINAYFYSHSIDREIDLVYYDREQPTGNDTLFQVEFVSRYYGTWTSDDAIEFYTVKSAQEYAVWWMGEGGATSGTWTTQYLLTPNQKNTPEVSHLTAYNPSTAVPEPATMLLFGTGLAGLAAVARRRKN